MTIAVSTLLPSNIVRAVIRFWKTQAGLSLLPDPEQGLETSPVPSRDKGQSQELFRGSGRLPLVGNTCSTSGGQTVGFQLLLRAGDVFQRLNSWWTPFSAEEV